MAFVSWDDEITKTKNRLSELTEDLSTMMTGRYSTGDRETAYRKIDEATAYLEFCRKQKAIESGGTRSTRISYGRHRRFR